MVKSIESPGASLPRGEVVKLLSDTAHAVKVMKASWLRVALNLKKIRRHELWRMRRVSSGNCGELSEDS